MTQLGVFVMDIPLLDDADDVGRVMTGFYWGAVVNVLGPTETPFPTDLVNTLEIALVGGDAPESVTADEMHAGANRAAVIRADGTAEIIHFQDVAATDAGTFVLSTLPRGGGAASRSTSPSTRPARCS